MIRVAVLLTVYNRKEVTLQGLMSLNNAIAVLGDGYIFDIYMTDDGSTDGTANEVKNKYPKTHIVQGNGNLYWNQGMRKAWIAAMESKVKYDFFLWYNDDTILYEESLYCIFNSYYNCKTSAAITGAVRSSIAEVTTYGGYINHRRISPNGFETAIDYMNGNVVLIPKVIVEKIGILDSFFRHSYGDWEYGYRIRKNGFLLFMTPCYVGTCDRHDNQEKCFDSSVPLTERLRSLFSPVGHHPKEVFYYGVKTEGLVYALKCVSKVVLKTLFPKL
jgi:GT2 family glycosyltransferase